MGVCCSKEGDADSFGNPAKRPSENVGLRVNSVIRDDEEIVEVLRREFRENPQFFLLNNLLMIIQFFENHKRDREICVTTTNKMEKELNTTLLKNETMECICPDTIFEMVNNNLKFRPLHGRKKHFSEPLIARRLFVVNDTIEVVNSMDIVQYTSIDKPAYQVRMEESSRKGFVRLKQIDTNKRDQQYIPSIDEPGPSGLQTPTDSEEFYEYAAITDLRTPKPLEIMESPERRDTLPITCFASRKIKKSEMEIQDLLDDAGSEFEVDAEDFFDNFSYVDAKGFMNYFKNALFPNSLGRSLGFTQDEIDLSKSIPGKIFCNLTDDDDNLIPCEVIPSVAIEWPSQQTFEFLRREDRPTIQDNKTGKRFKWPTDQMIKEICSLSCVLVPKGYWKKRGTDSDATLEWEIAFPKAERYLEARMTHAQIKCFLYLLVIHKALIEPVTQLHGLLVEHIRCHMYWECEANYRDWPEHRLGTKILKVIENLNVRLSKSELPDYFIKQKNQFRNIPKKYLQFAQKIFHELLQNPVIYFIKALRGVRYSTGRFYSPFEFKEFYRMLIQTQGYKLVNPNLMNGPGNIRKRTYNDPETQWKHLHEIQRRKLILEKRNRQMAKIEEDYDKVSVDSIDLEWTCEKQFEIFKIKAILSEFIKSMIDVAKDTKKFGGTENQIMFYLKQALYLNVILESTSPSFLPEAREFKIQIYKEQEAVLKSAVLRISDVPPETPVRNSIQFDFTVNQQLKNNLLNLGNLHNSYTGGGSKLTHTISVKPVRSPILQIKSNKNTTVNRRKSVQLPGRKSVAFAQPM